MEAATAFAAFAPATGIGRKSHTRGDGNRIQHAECIHRHVPRSAGSDTGALFRSRATQRLVGYSFSGGRSKLTRSPRKPSVFHAPKAMPTSIQIPPTIHAFQLRFFHRKKQMVKPASGGVHTARTASTIPATM